MIIKELLKTINVNDYDAIAIIYDNGVDYIDLLSHLKNENGEVPIKKALEKMPSDYYGLKVRRFKLGFKKIEIYLDNLKVGNDLEEIITQQLEDIEDMALLLRTKYLSSKTYKQKEKMYKALGKMQNILYNLIKK